MPGFVMVLAWVKNAGGALLAEKMIGVLAGTLGAAAVFAIALKLVMTMTVARSRARRPRGWRRVCPCPHAVVAALIFAPGRPASRCRASSGRTCPRPRCWRSRSRCW